MARAQALDYLHNMRFQVEAVDPTINAILTAKQASDPQAGFSGCTIPEATVETVEYKEGQYLYTRKFPGNVTYNDVTLSRGVARVKSQFWQWIQGVIEGTSGEYRTDLKIMHFHRTDTMPGKGTALGQINGTLSDNLNFDTPSKVYYLVNAFPVRHKFSADLDATDSAVSVMELDVAYEHCYIEAETVSA